MLRLLHVGPRLRPDPGHCDGTNTSDHLAENLATQFDCEDFPALDLSVWEALKTLSELELVITEPDSRLNGDD